MSANIAAINRPSEVYLEPDTNTDLALDGQYPRAIYVGATGNLVLRTIDGDDVLFEAVPDGSILPVAFSQVRATGTTASALIALY